MGPYIWLAVHDAAAFAAGTYLVVSGFPWWGGLCFLFIAAACVKCTNHGRLKER